MARDERVVFASVDRGTEESFDPNQPAEPESPDLRLHHAAYRHMMAEHNGGTLEPLRLSTFSDVPAGSGLGSSSALTVAIVKALAAALDVDMDNERTARLAYRVERDDLGLAGGKQDHYSAAYGGINFVEFNKDDSVNVQPVTIDTNFLAELEHSLVLYFTGVSRDSANIISDQLDKIAGDDQDTYDSLHRIKEIAYEMRGALERGDVPGLASLLHDSWVAKRAGSPKASTPHIDGLYEAARAAGALGGKISGAGGGGYMMLLCPPELRGKVLAALPRSEEQDCNCTFDREGTVTWHTEP